MKSARKIAVHELEVGMTVVDTGLSWIEHPYLYARGGQVDSRSQIQAILAEGYAEVFVHDENAPDIPDDSNPPAQECERPADHEYAVAPIREPWPPSEVFPYRRELKKAKVLYKYSLEFAKNLVIEAKQGKPTDFRAAMPLVEAVIASVNRNPDAMVSLIKLKAFDDYTYTHGINVSILAVVFGRYLGMEEERLQQLGAAGIFHDLGKTMVPEALLNKPGLYTEEEFQAVKGHPALGVAMLAGQPGVSDEVLMAVGQHHEKFNGSGYPQGLKGKELSQEGQILALADVYDALTSKRVYKDASIPMGAMRIMFSLRGLDFSPQLLDLFVKCLGIFPVGSMVRLKNGHVAVVCRSNPKWPLLPTVKIVLDRHLHPMKPVVLDLASSQGRAMAATHEIAENLDHAVLRLDPTSYLT